MLGAIAIVSLLVGQPAMDVERRCREYRLGIHAMHLILHVEALENGARLSRQYEIRMDGGNSRQDTYMPYTQSAEGGSRDRYRAVASYRGLERYWWSDQRLEDGKTFAFLVQYLDNENERSKMQRKDRMLDPRKIGLFPLPAVIISADFPIDDSLSVASRAPNQRQIAETDWRGKRAVGLTHKLANGTETKFVVVPEMGYNPVYLEANFRAEQIMHRDAIEVDVQLHEPSGIWFPVSLKARRTEDGVATGWEDVQVEIKSINEHIKEEEFGASGLGVPVGTLVTVLPLEDPRGQMFWDGKEIRPLTPTAQLRISLWRRFWLVALIVALSVAAGVASYRAVRSWGNTRAT